MKKQINNISLREIAELTGAEIFGNDDIDITGLNTLDDAGSSEISFFANKLYEKAAKATGAGAILCAEPLGNEGKVTYLVVKEPYLAFVQTLRAFYSDKHELDSGIDQSAIINKTAKLGENCTIAENVVIGKNVVLGDNCVISANSVISDYSTIGNNAYFYPNVTIREKCVIGNNVIINSGTVVGSDGYGFVWDGQQHLKIPQVGNVVIEDNVEIGSNCSIDRGALGSTVIGAGTKLDNLVQIAHNVKIGKNSLIVAQVGIAGSTKIGNFVTLAGQVGVVGHLEISDQVVVASKSGVTKSLKEPGVYYGLGCFPSKPIGGMRRLVAFINNLPKLFDRVKSLEKLIAKQEK